MPEPWGGSKKIYTSSKGKYDRLHERFPEDFPTLSNLFQLAAAIGMKEGEVARLKQRDELINVYSIDSDLLEPLIAMLHPNLQDHERLERLMEHAEYGINLLWKDIEELQTVILEPYLE